MLNNKYISSITERDIDLLILEELSVSDEFREWFATRVFARPVYESAVGAWHSVNDPLLGESDLVFVFRAKGQQRMAVLIENKIDAPPQPDQGARYKLRGNEGVMSKWWDEYQTCIIAPAKYLGSAKQTEKYNVEMSYEEILAYFQSRSSRDERFSYKATVLLEGIEQNRRGYQPTHSKEMTSFVAEYSAFASMNYGHLGVHEAKPRPAGSTWVEFSPKSLPKDIGLAHQLTSGFVKLFFKGQADRFDELEEQYRSYLPENAVISPAKKSVSISMEVPKVDPITDSFATQQRVIEEALRCLSALERAVLDGMQDKFAA